jgi:hypothetical protein
MSGAMDEEHDWLSPLISDSKYDEYPGWLADQMNEAMVEEGYD